MVDDRGFIADIEAQVIGAILIGGSHPGIFSLLEERHFIDPVHQEIYRASRVARERFSSTKLHVVTQLIDVDIGKQFKAATGVDIGAYMAECTSTTIYSAANGQQAARNVIAQWARITLGTQLATFQAAAQSSDADALVLVRAIGELLDEVSSDLRRGGRGKTRLSLQQAGQLVLATAREARSKNGLTGITTGLIDLDKLTGGLQRRDLILLGARPSMGKTSVATCIAASAASAGNGVGFLSLEMDTAKLMARVYSDLLHRRGLHVAYEDLIKGTASDEAFGWTERMVAEAKLPLWVDDQAGLSITDIRIKVEAMVADAEAAGFPLDLLIVDHLLKVRPTSRYAGNRVHEIAEITEGLKELAREFNLAVLLLTQLNRAVETRDDKRPTLADLRDSGAIEQDADAVMFLYREAYYLQREKPTTADKVVERDRKLEGCRYSAEIEIAKQRNGQVKSIDLWCDMAYSAVRNAVHYGQYSEAA